MLSEKQTKSCAGINRKLRIGGAEQAVRQTLDMAAIFGQGRFMHRLSAFLACLTLIVTTLLPAGTMAARAQDGSLTIRVCNAALGNSPVITPDHPFYDAYVLIQQSEQNQSDTDTGDDGAPCDMGAAPMAHLPSAPEFAVFAVHNVTQTGAPVALTGIFPSGLPPSTGPPIS